LGSYRPTSFNFIGSRGLLEDEEGRIWIGGAETLGYLKRQATGEWIYRSALDELPPGALPLGVVWYIEPSAFGLVVLGDHGILRLRDGKWQHWAFEGKQRPQPIRSEGRFLLTWKSGHVAELTESGPIDILVVDQFENRRIFGGRIAPDGTQYYYGASKIYKVRDGVVSVTVSTSLPQILEGMWTCAMPLSDGRVAIGTYQKGLAIFDDQTDSIVWVDGSSGLQSNAVSSLKRDSEGRLWIATTLGVTVMEADGGIIRIPIKGGGHRGVFIGNNYLITNGSDGANRILFSIGGSSIIPLFNGSYIVHFKEFTNSTVLGLTASGVYTQRRDEQPLLIRRASQRVSALFIDPQTDNSWIFSLDSSTYRYQWIDGKIVEEAVVIPEVFLASNITGSTAYDGAIWTTNADGDIQSWSMSKGILSSVNIPLKESSDRAILSAENGVVLVEDMRIGLYRPESKAVTWWDAFKGWRLHRAARGTQPGELWILAERARRDPRGAEVWYVLRTDTRGTAPEVYHLPIGNIVSAGISLAVEPSGEALWIGDAESVRRVPRAELREAPVPKVAPTLWTEMDPEQDRVPLRIRFSAAPPARLDMAAVEVRLQPIEDGWRVATEPLRELGGLRAGSFTFEARYRSADGQPGPVARFAFVIPPPWYLHPAALTGFGILLLGSGAAAVRRRLAILEGRRLELERLVDERTADLVKANAAKTEFIARMSHELRNPMNGVVGLSEVLLQRLRHPEERSLVQTLRACAGMLDQMIGDVLDVARIDSDQVALDHRPFTLRSVLEDAMAIVAWDATRLDKEITLNAGPDDTPALEGDPSKVQQILVNFLSNACKYSTGSFIHLRATVQAPVSHRRLVRLEVEDEGPGLNDEDRARIFERFFRTESARQGSRRGTGLGLAICRELAERMGGTVGVLPNTRGGSTFFMELTCPVAAGSAAVVDGVGVSFSGRRALVVDDMDHNRLVAGALLGHLGFIVDHAEDGTQALEALAAGNYDCALLDWDLPDFDGIEVARRFRKSHPRSRTRLIACTAFATPDRIEICIAAGMQSHVSKPVTENKLRRALGAALASAPATPATDKLDLAALRLLAGADPDRLAQQIERFVTTLEEEVAALLAAEASHQRPQVRRHLHRLLSHAGIVAAADLVKAIEEAQHLGSKIPDDQPSPGLDQVHAVSAALARDLRATAARTQATV